MATLLPGVEVLLNSQASLLKGLRVGLVTNQTGLDAALHADIVTC
jgi:uncharacterized protein YbbC (DUF1343 family)